MIDAIYLKEVQTGNISQNTCIERKEKMQQILQMLKFVSLCKRYYALYYFGIFSMSLKLFPNKKLKI